MNPNQKDSKPQKKGPSTPNKRTRRHEAEEDKELLQAAAAEEAEEEPAIRITGENAARVARALLTVANSVSRVDQGRRNAQLSD